MADVRSRTAIEALFRSPRVIHQVYVLDTCGRLSILDAASGRLVREFSAGSAVQVFSVTNGVLLNGNGRLWITDDRGTVRWERTWDPSRGERLILHTVAGHCAVFGSPSPRLDDDGLDDGWLGADGLMGSLVAIDSRAFAEVWRRESVPLPATILAGPSGEQCDVAYSMSHNPHVVWTATPAVGLTPVWTREGRSIGLASARKLTWTASSIGVSRAGVLGDGRVWYEEETEEGDAFTVRTRKGIVMWRRRVTARSLLPPVVTPRGIFVISANRINLFSLSTGRTMWSRPTEAGELHQAAC